MTNQSLPDTRPLFLSALDQLTPIVESVTVGDLDAPTPCEGWVVRDLLSHLVAVQDRVARVTNGGHFAEVPSQVEGIADEEWVVQWQRRLGALREAVADDAVLTRIMQHPAGAMPGAKGLAIYASELAVHAWDLAMALGSQDVLDQRLAGALVGPITASLPAEPRGTREVPFAAVVPVPEEAPAYDRLVGWVGRDPQWRAAA